MGDVDTTYFDEAAAQRVCDFFERYLILPETGQPFVLQTWQRDILRYVFGTKNADATRLVRTLYIEVPKKNGKSAFASGIALYLLCADGEPSAEVYSVAGDASQAGIIFDAAKKMVKASAKLAKIVQPYRYSLIAPKTSSTYRVVSAEATTKEGIKASGILFDELHIQPDRKLWDTLRGSGLARRQPLTVVTTTAGDSRTSVGWEVHDYATRVAAGKVIDPTFKAVIFAADEEADDVHSPDVWQKANPSYGVTFTERDFRTRYGEAASAGPAALASWKRYHLNIWSQASTAWLPMDAWDKCGKRNVSPDALKKQSPYAALDISSTTDLTALTLLFPVDDGYEVLAYSWMPRAKVIDAERRDRVPYRQWAAQGYLDLTDGSAIDYKHVLRRIVEIDQSYPFINRQVALDEYNAWQMMESLKTEGLEPIPVSQKARGMSAPCKELLRLVVDGKLWHGANPLLTYQAQCVESTEDVDGNIRLVKGKGEARKRIDNIVCLAMCLNRALVGKGQSVTSQSVYESRGVLVL